MVRFARALAVASVCSLLFVEPGVTYVQSWPPVLVTDPPADNQSIGEGLASDPDGNFVVAWGHEPSQGGGNIHFRRISADGTPLGEPVAVTTGRGFNYYPAIASDDAGNFVLAWMSTPDFQSYVIHVRRYDAVGEMRGPEATINVPTGPSPFLVRLAVNPAGDYALGWRSAGAVRVQAFGSDGGPLADAFAVTGFDKFGALALTPQRTIALGAVTAAGTEVRCFGIGGAPHGDGVFIPLDGATNFEELDLAAGPTGTVTVAWSEADNGETSLLVRQIDDDCGTVLWASEVEHTYGNTYAIRPRLAVNRAGSQIGVGWAHETPAAGYSVYARNLDAQDGTPLEEPYAIASHQSPLGSPRLAIGPDGAITAAWYIYDSSGSGRYRDIYAAGTLLSPVTARLVGNISLREGETRSAAVQLSRHATSDVHVNLGVQGGLGAGDLVFPELVTIAAGQHQVIVPVHAPVDGLVEGPEAGQLAITGVSGAGLGSSPSIAVSVADADFYPYVWFETAGTTTREGAGASVALTATLSDVTIREVRIHLTPTGNASRGQDYAVDNDWLIIPAGQSSGTKVVRILNNGVIEQDEQVTFTMDAFTNVLAYESLAHTITIKDNDPEAAGVRETLQGLGAP